MAVRGMNCRRVALVALLVPLAVRANGLFTPETSKLFVRNVDKDTGVVSYVLKPGLVSHNQQSLYFTAKSMTDDGRFLVFDMSDDEFAVKDGQRVKINTENRVKAVVDFAKDEVVKMPGIGGQIPFVDVKNDRVVYVDERGLFKRELKDDPAKEILICRLPPELTPRNPKAWQRYHTHLTATRDGKKFFFDACIDRKYVIGLLDGETGKFELWGNTDEEFCSNHGQMCPVDDALALGAWEYSWEKRCWNKERTKRERVHIAQDEYNYRLWLWRPGCDFENFPPIEGGYATHENFSVDGTSFYWNCGIGVFQLDLKTGLQECLVPVYSGHAMQTADRTGVTFDQPAEDWYRGVPWHVWFSNQKSGRMIRIHTTHGAYAQRDNASNMHPDPHPQFVCNDRYVVCTLCDPGRLNLSVTPVGQLYRLTEGPSDPPPAAHELAIPFDASADVSAPCELLFDRAALLSAKTADRLRAFGVRAETPSGARDLTVRTLKSQMNNDEYLLRFSVPRGTRRLTLVTNRPEKFRVGDSAREENLFGDPLRIGEKARWVADNGGRVEWLPARIRLKGGAVAKPRFGIEAAIPPGAAGKPVKLEFDVRNRSKFPFLNAVRLVQFDAQGERLDSPVVSGAELSACRPVDVTSRYRVDGRLDARAAKVRLEIAAERPNEFKDDYGREIAEPGEIDLQVQRLALRTGTTLRLSGAKPSPQVKTTFANRQVEGVDAASYGTLADTLFKGIDNDTWKFPKGAPARVDRLLGWIRDNRPQSTPAEVVAHLVRCAALPALVRPDLGDGVVQVFYDNCNHFCDVTRQH